MKIRKLVKKINAGSYSLHQGASDMIGSDVALAYVDGYLGYVDDYNITSRSPCSGVVGVKKGVCRDTAVQGGDNNQIQVLYRYKVPVPVQSGTKTLHQIFK